MPRRGLMLAFAFGYALIAAAMVFAAWIALQNALDRQHGVPARAVYMTLTVVCLYGVYLASRLSRRMLELRRGPAVTTPAVTTPAGKPQGQPAPTPRKKARR